MLTVALEITRQFDTEKGFE